MLLRRKANVAAWLIVEAVFLSIAANAAVFPRHATLSFPSSHHYAINHFGEYFGIGTATVTSMAEDGQGFLWIGTQTGVYRYDDNVIKLFTIAEGLPSNHVDQLLVAPDGSLWVRTRKGLATFKHQRFVVVPLRQDVQLRETPQSIAVDSSGTIFVATNQGLLQVTQQGDSTECRLIDPVGAVDALIRGPDDTIWYASERVLHRWLRGSPHSEIVLELTPTVDPIKALLLNGQGELWIRTQNRLGILDTNRIEQPVWQDPGIPGANLYGAPTLDRSGNLLLPTSQGLYRSGGLGWEIITRNSGLTSSAVFSALEDREGNIWVGLAGAGLDRIPGSRQWWGWTEGEGLPDSLVLGVLRDHQSRLWVGTNNGLAMWNDARHEWRTWSAKNGLPGSGIRELAVGRDGSVWALSLEKGLVRFDPSDQGLAPERVPLNIGDWHANSISIAADGSVWTDGNKSLHRVQISQGKFSIQDIAIPPNMKGSTDVVAFAPDGALWTGGDNGLSRLANGKWRHFTVADGLLNNSIRRLAVNRDGSVWIGYSDEDSSTKATLGADGKLKVSHLKQAVCALGEDKEKNTWFELDKGVGVLSAAGNFHTFTENDGLLWNDVNCNAFWQETDGSILIGTSRGLSRYDSNQVKEEVVPPQVVLTSIRFGKQEHVEDKSPRVEYTNRAFVAEFATLFFQNKSQLACRYRLRNLENEWSDTKLHEIRYTSLPPGGYTLEVNCGSPTSGWAKRPISYAFFIAPPWWLTWWAETAGAGGLILLIWLFVNYHTVAQRREKARLETAVAERSAELAKANRELKETSLRDPLTGVYNRRFFHTTISADASVAIRAYSTKSDSYSRDHRDLIFFLLDLDHFKQVNDTYGHDAGDQVLMEVAARLNEVVRKSDFLIRWGGEEFMIVCRAAQREEASLTARRILTTLSEKPFQVGKESVTIPITCSIGWAPFPWSQDEPSSLPVTEVIKLADRGLYLAKQRGRNRAIGSTAKTGTLKSASGCVQPQIEESEVTEVSNECASQV